MGANKKIITLADVKRHGFQLGIRCQCGHHGTVDIDKTLRWFACHCWTTMIPQAHRHFRCLACARHGVRKHDRMPIRIGLSADLPADLCRFPASEDGWKDLVRRLRG